MRQLFFAAMACLALSSCEDILPVDNVDLCDGDEPISAECEQCSGERKAAGCPQCQGGSPAAGCENASGVSGGGKAGDSGDGARGGSNSGSGGIRAGEGGESGTGSGGSSGSGDAGQGGVAASGSGGSTAAGTGGAGSGWSCGDGGSSGDGGDGGTQPPPCLRQGDCANPQPECNAAGSCVACEDDDACVGRAGTEHCEKRTGAEKPGQCVECTNHAHCADPTKPQCNAAGACEQCTDHGACSEHAGATKCDLADESTLKGRCVECLAHAHCTDLGKPECSSERTCVACTGDAACSERPATTKCNLYDGAEKKGHCVECTGENESTKCGNNSCKRATGTCTSTRRGNVGLCEPCQADSECGLNAACVAHAFNVQALGTFCFYSDPDGDNCADDNALRKPYSERLMDVASIDGVPGPFCAPVTTCQAIKDANTQKPCTASEECGVADLVDATCQGSKCTYACTQSSDCLRDDAPGRFSDCLPPGTAGYCQ